MSPLKFFDSLLHMPQDPAELFLVEGDSAAQAGALVQIFFLQCMRPLLESGRVQIVHAPWGEIRSPDAEPRLSFHAAEYQKQCRDLAQSSDIQRIRYRGLGTITPAVLERCCVNPATRLAQTLSVADAQMAASVFGGERPVC